ncbi:hypothetical protein B0H16DRAFT_1499862 [Mycena metata]|uniref:Transmembrane protein n=1 Tax=Mycena metata TaxID=1033252 RepID=A0AAD7K764_9AGAR|nr:hypothetical protein B0H16DRAFT_1499862 [Mycena metata]
MPVSPRTSAFIWAGILVVQLVVVCLVIILGRVHLKERWYNIVLLVFMVIAAILAAATSRRWWRIHQTQQRTAGLPMAAIKTKLPMGSELQTRKICPKGVSTPPVDRSEGYRCAPEVDWLKESVDSR